MIAYLWLTLVLGTFFAISGFRKTFVESTRSKVFGLFSKYNVPKPAGWAVVVGEFLGGVGLLLPFLGLFSPIWLIPWLPVLSALAAFLLLPIMAGAIKLSVLPTLRRAWQAQSPGRLQKLSNFLCTAEVQMTSGLVALVFMYLF